MNSGRVCTHIKISSHQETNFEFLYSHITIVIPSSSHQPHQTSLFPVDLWCAVTTKRTATITRTATVSDRNHHHSFPPQPPPLFHFPTFLLFSTTTHWPPSLFSTASITTIVIGKLINFSICYNKFKVFFYFF